MTLEEYLIWLKKNISPGEFKPCALINAHAPGKMLEIFWSNEAYFVERLTNRIFLCKSFEDRNKIVGVQFEGLDKLLEEGFA